MQAHQGRRRPSPALPRPQQPIDQHDAPARAEPAVHARPWRLPENELPITAGMEIDGEATALPLPRDAHTATDKAPNAILDQRDELIAAGLDTRRLSVAAGETGVVHVALLNNGDRHVRFQIHVEGWIDEEWVRILRDGQEEAGRASLQLWLHPAERALLTIAITPPRTPASRAGERPFAVVIRTTDYDNRLCRLGALLTIQPYHDLSLGEIIPRRPRAGWRHRTLSLALPVTNRGNVAAELFIQGHDARRQCQIAFLAPGGRQWQARRATFTLAPGKTVQLRLRVTPPTPPLFGLRTRTSQIGLAVGYLKAAGTPLSATATVTTQPLVGPWLLAALCGLGGLIVMGAFLMTAVAAIFAARSAPAPALVQPTPLPPQVITVVVQLAQPAPMAPARTLRDEGGGAGEAPSSPVVDPASDAMVETNAPIVRPDQVTAPGTPYRPSTFRPVESLPPVQLGPPVRPTRATYQQMFQEIGLQYDLNWRMLAAQAYVESSFDSLALSNSGAMGLMQILPGTWREWAPVVNATDPFDAYSSTLVAAVYLDYLRGELGKRGLPQTEWMLVAYNWGIDRLVEHLEAGRTWEDLPPGRRQYAEEILRIAQTIPPG